ncbi:MAG: transketolase C-terminal domain-containing protein [Candidatus Accumulibacter sp.]|uniref:transketolase family protein n=1 Tax=Accumulibacter sp. TaxID=2053492 RepID=UPI00287995F5|nr:transketolase C-terminal domain-containing protein [Accumulibacter sp.]MDS4013430.1 transketolase C-terminal domain-containing protein [Accumulibacter sp.]
MSAPTIQRPRAMRDALLERIVEAMRDDASIFFVCADFGSPVLDRLREQYPERFVNVGIAEQNLINVSAGLALEGFKVFAYAIAPFITMRCFEQIRVSLALLSTVRPMNVNLVGVGAGFSYVVSGPTHQCYEDLTLMRAMPNMAVYSPADHATAASLFEACMTRSGPKYLRLDAQALPPLYPAEARAPAEGFHVHGNGSDLCLVATGFPVHTALRVAATLRERGVASSVVDLFDLSTFDAPALLAQMSAARSVVSLEEGFRGRGGLDALLFDLRARAGQERPMLNLGVEGGYRFELGSRQQLHEQVSIGETAVTGRILDFLGLPASQT